ncbi:MAG: hypothetical protein LAN18_08440 [Acidobacteriia bacterium]|nr:hypothetical protein [Terriglobia bacterium]
MRLILRATVCLVLLLGLAAAKGRPAAAQGDEDLLPEQSAAKAKAILQQVISALGGRAFLNVRDSDCTGRLAQFGHSGQMLANTPFRELWLLPAKNRMEYITKGEHNIAGYLLGADRLSIVQGGVLITVFDGDRGWILDKSGVSSQPEGVIKSFAEQVKSGMNNMLRSRMGEDGVEFRYAGTDLVDLKEAEWIEISDRDHRVLRMAVEKSTHLPLRWVVATRDPETRARTEIVTSYTQFVSVDGVQTPLSVSRAQNGSQVSQIFFTGCKYNSNLSPQLFTPASLEQRSSQATKKGYKDGKDNK